MIFSIPKQNITVGQLGQADIIPLLRSESSVVERNHSFHIPRNCDFRPEWHFFFSLTSKKTQIVREESW
jgi:hypothetical protein